MSDQDKLNSLFLKSAMEGNAQVVTATLKAGADVHKWGDAALFWASHRGHTETVKALIEGGADLHSNEDAALRTASANGHTEAVRALLAAGADIHARDDEALQSASRNGCAGTMKELLAASDNQERGQLVADFQAAVAALAVIGKKLGVEIGITPSNTAAAQGGSQVQAARMSA